MQRTVELERVVNTLYERVDNQEKQINLLYASLRKVSRYSCGMRTDITTLRDRFVADTHTEAFLQRELKIKNMQVQLELLFEASTDQIKRQMEVMESVQTLMDSVKAEVNNAAQTIATLQRIEKNLIVSCVIDQ